MLNWLKEDKLIFNWVPTFIWAFVILFFSILPYRGQLSLTIGYFDKVAHFSEFTLLAVLIIRSIYRMWDISHDKICLFTLISATGYGIVMELVQLFVPGRTVSVYDLAANVAGMVFGVILGRWILWQK